MEWLIDNKTVGTVVVIVTALFVRFGTELFFLRRLNLETEQRRRVLSNLRNGLVILVVLALVMIWAPALRTFALSLTAFAVAMIVATKELILCISGSVVKATSGSMKVGSWIEVSGMRGEVVDQTLMTTTIQELGKEGALFDYTGRTIVIPNSLFLTAPVVNERFFKHFVFQPISVVVDAMTDPVPVEAAIIQTVNDAMVDHIDLAKRYNHLIETRAGIDIHDPEPRTKISTLNDGRIKITVTAFLPTRRAVEIENTALHAAIAEAQRQVIARTETK